MHFGDELLKKVTKTSPVCVGIDPRIEAIPTFLKDAALEEFGDTAEAVATCFTDFSCALIDVIADLVPIIKPQLAFFEMYGAAGIQSFEDVCAYANEKGLLVIADGKRNDIGSTASAYAKAFLGESPLINSNKQVMQVDALTVNPYLGSDSIYPFIETAKESGKGMFVLVKTSNPSSSEIQDLAVGDEMLHEEMAHLVSGWGREFVGQSGFSSVGAVVGATYPEEARYLRSLMPQQWFLVPGYGAQGGGAEDVKPCFNVDGYGAIINSSRGINFAYLKNDKYSEKNFDDAARVAVKVMIDDLKTIAP